MSTPWNNHFPNALGAQAAKKREAAAAQARLRLAQTRIAQALAELAPFAPAHREQDTPVARVYGHLIAAREGIGALLQPEKEPT